MYSVDFLLTDPSVIRLDWNKFMIFYEDVNGAPAGIFLIHYTSDHDQCVLPVDFRPDDGGEFYTQDKVWLEMESKGGLTLMPSIICPECRLHGYIYEGKWMSKRPFWFQIARRDELTGLNRIKARLMEMTMPKTDVEVPR